MRRQIRIRANAALAAAAVLLGVAGAFGARVPSLDEVGTALRENLPQIALQKLDAIEASQPDATAHVELTRLRAEALLAAEKPEAALELLQPLMEGADKGVALLQAHCFARAARWTEARAAYARLAVEPGARLAAVLGVAEACQALGDTAAAISALEPVVRTGKVPAGVRLRLASFYVESEQVARARQMLSATKATSPEDKLWVRYIEGRLFLLENQPAAARAAFSEISTPQARAPQPYVTENLFVAATLGRVEAKIALQGYEAADNELETFIWNYPESAWLELVFRRLDQIYALERNPAESELQKWAKKPNQRRAALAQYYVAKLQVRGKKWEKALVSLDTFVRGFPGHQLMPFVELMRADVFIQKGELEAAGRALEGAARVAGEDDALRAEVELRTGLVQFRQREFVLAATSFDRAAERVESVSNIALYDAALAWLNQTNYERFIEELKRLAERGVSTEVRGNLALEEGLIRARLGDATARATLRKFLTDFPTHPRVAEARLADAELAYAAKRPGEAMQLLRVANAKTRSPEVDDQEAYLAVFLADARKPRDEAEVIRLAKEFLRSRPKSVLLPEVRMKLGQVYFQQPDYPNAETQFATLAQEAPLSAYAEPALFLAGQAAMRTINPGSTERALAYFDEVVKRNGPLRLHAREQQAIVQGSLGKDAEAVALYDLILQSKQPAPDDDLRAAAFIGKGDALSRKDAQQAEAAVAVYTELAELPEASPAWRDQALYKKAKLLDQLGRKGEAIGVLNDVLDRNLASPDRELFWFYKAGFEAGRHFEDESAWPSAIAIYEKVAKVQGPRQQEAQKRARQLRVEHFVWD